jgi:putative ABC transport system permease protein
MILWEILRLAFSSLAANKLRSILTMVGIAVGVFSVIGVMTIISGLRGSIEGGLNVLGANSFEITKYPALNFSDPRQRFANRKDISYEQAERFKDLMGSSAEVSVQAGRDSQRVFYRDNRTNPNVFFVGSDENGVSSRNFDVAAGRNLGREDVEFARPVALLGNDIVERLFALEDPIGKVIRVDDQTFTVVGLLSKKGTAFGQSQDNIVIVPITRFLNNLGRWRSLNLNVKAPSAAELIDTQEQAIGTMRLVRGLEPEDPNDFELFSNESLIEAFNNIAGVVAVGAFVVSAIALLASGVGVMNIMLVSVTERTHEIGIRKSVGAKKRNILVQFLIEAIALSLVGGLGGIFVGIVGGNIVGALLSVSPIFPWGWALVGLLVCGGIGVSFGLYPAWRAASLDPIEALRHE